MPHIIKSFGEFLNEAVKPTLNPAIKGDKNQLSPAQLKTVENLNKSSLAELKALKISIGADTLTFDSIYNHNSNMVSIIEKQVVTKANFGNSFKIQFFTKNGDSIVFYTNVKDVPKSGVSLTRYNNSLDISIHSLSALYYANAEDIIKALTIAITEAVKNSEKVLKDYLESKGSELKAFVLSIGVVNIGTGETEHGWSIYDQPQTKVFLTDSRFLLFCSPDTFNIGDNVFLFGNDK